MDNLTRNIEEERRLNSPTTLVEYIGFCHFHLFNSIVVETSKSRTTKGDGITNPNGRACPHRLAQWPGFILEQKRTLQYLIDAYPPDDPRLFECEAFIQDLGKRVASRKLASELDIYPLQRDIIEFPVSLILRHLHTFSSFRKRGHREDEAAELATLYFSSTFHTRTSAAACYRPAALTFDSNFRPDNKTKRTLAIIVEYKPPHQVTLSLLQQGLHDMDLDDVINNVSLPNRDDSTTTFQYHADRVVASTVTQAFSYMISGGVRFGYITTGQAFVFLHIPLEDPTTLYYYLVEPQAGVDAQKIEFPDDSTSWHRTAIAQVLAFCLMALQSLPADQNWCTEAILDQLPGTLVARPRFQLSVTIRTLAHLANLIVMTRPLPQSKRKARARQRPEPSHPELLPPRIQLLAPLDDQSETSAPNVACEDYFEDGCWTINARMCQTIATSSIAVM
ncbi:hypothetical protein GP486_005205 [Trichoglossum hirsutum]|uniref:Uncharacterized protein n=1 Tax=Trichoglossum hirsutum TaxID=265104 RepID=A0A9P8L9Q3_9PEZI|nr:hypothetical protein GP486_005205 [Trichoglossum hirsutum]